MSYADRVVSCATYHTLCDCRLSICRLRVVLSDTAYIILVTVPAGMCALEYALAYRYPSDNTTDHVASLWDPADICPLEQIMDRHIACDNSWPRADCDEHCTLPVVTGMDFAQA